MLRPSSSLPLTEEHVVLMNCITHCDDLVSGYSPYNQQALDAFLILSDQVIVAGMGSILGLNHLSIHAYFQMMEYSGAQYRMLFHRVLQLDGEFRSVQRKYSKQKEDREKMKRDGVGASNDHGGQVSGVSGDGRIIESVSHFVQGDQEE